MNWGFRKKEAPTTGLTLSGGGMRGIAHIGILKALEEFGIKPTIISGSSIGSIVGAFYAYGYTPDEILEIAKRGNYFTRQNLSLSSTSIFKSEMLLALFRKHIPRDSFENLKIPLYVSTTELTNGVVETFHTGKLHQILLASASIPYIFPPIKIGKKLYSDGGIMNNLPIECIRDKSDFLVGVHVNAIDYDALDPMNTKRFFSRIIHLAIGTPVSYKKNQCELFIEPKGLEHFSIFNARGIELIFTMGYDSTKEFLIEKGYKPLKN